MKMTAFSLHALIACATAALLAGCGGNNGLSPSTLTSVSPSLAGPCAGLQSRGSQPLGVREPLATKYKSLYSFKGGTDGELPYAALIAVGGKLYSTTYEGGASGVGTVFEVSTSGKERVLYSFGTDGAYPAGG
jgi:uncharacterized repeat protein (TIGR03803 family)